MKSTMLQEVKKELERFEKCEQVLGEES